MFYKFFSQRQRGEEVSDVLQYDDLPESFRNQFFRIISDIGRYDEHTRMDILRTLDNEYCREKGLKHLGIHDSDFRNGVELNFSEYIDSAPTSELLDLIDFVCSALYRFIQNPRGRAYLSEQKIQTINKLFKELNGRFKQHNLGYEVINGQLVRIDNQVVHAQYVKPALQLLCDKEFAGAEEEYRNAFEARRAGNNKDAILNAGKCFESVMKIICRKKYNADVDNCAAGALLDKLEQKEIFPKYMNKHFEKIVDTLRFGVPTVRNKVAGHGQGSEITEAPDYLVDYVLGLVAVNSVLLVKLYKESN